MVLNDQRERWHCIRFSVMAHPILPILLQDICFWSEDHCFRTEFGLRRLSAAHVGYMHKSRVIIIAVLCFVRSELLVSGAVQPLAYRPGLSIGAFDLPLFWA